MTTKTKMKSVPEGRGKEEGALVEVVEDLALAHREG